MAQQAWHLSSLDAGTYLLTYLLTPTTDYYYLATQLLWWKLGIQTTTQKKKICTRRKALKSDYVKFVQEN
jgi:hypothetical protein